ncbi:MAG: ABC transporter permease [Dehalococcoidia bacterium]|nr:ABC transporter permease [Dehalococcoidia bacterium]
MLKRIGSVILKEFIQLVRDRRTLVILMLVPVMQLFIFGYALSTDVKHIPMAIWDTSRTQQSRDLIQSFSQTEFFNVKHYASSYDEVNRLIESGSVKVALIIPGDFARKVERGETAEVQVFIDGSDPTVSVQALSYSNLIIQAKSVSIVAERTGGRGFTLPIDVEPRVWYNPAMESLVFNIPGLVGVIAGIITTMLTAFAVVRERETGTIEQLNVTPLRRGELIVGKLIPYIVIAYAQMALILIVAVTVFDMNIKGSLALLMALTSVFLLFSLGLGLLISTLSRTQFQAQQLSFATMLPTILLSGFIFPIESMPQAIQWISSIIPLTYYLHIVRGIVVKGIGFEYLWMDTLILAVMGTITVAIAATRLRRTLG